MHILLNISILALSALALIPLLAAAPSVKETSEDPLKASSKAAEAWLSLADKGKYGETWDEASALMKLTIQKDEWVHILTQMRQSLGSVSSRKTVDQRTAKNPHGLPHGDYMVMFYKTNFAHKNDAFELLTLFREDGEWRTVTYQVN